MVVSARDGRISRWHDYMTKGPPGTAAFLGTEGKAWRWGGQGRE